MKIAASGAKIIGIGDAITSDNPSDVLVTYSLGSCIGVTLYDPNKHIGGMIHCLLPLSTMDKEKATKNPYLFVDTGVAQFLLDLLNLGADKKSLICKVAGAGTPLEDKTLFRTGERNYAVLKKFLWKNDILIKGEKTGGKQAKTLYLHLSSGRTTVTLDGTEELDI